jgi:hypothetical protein
MKQRNRRSWVRQHPKTVLLIGAFVVTLPLYGLFGEDLPILGEILGQDTISAKNIVDDVQLARAMATHLHDKQWMKTVAADAGPLYVKDHYGENVDVARVLNGDDQYGVQAAVEAWQKSAADSGDTGFLAGDTPGKSARLARVASIALSDAAAGNCLQVVGQYRGNDSANQTAMKLLAALHLDDGDDSNSQVTQQNIGNGFAMQQLNELRSANAMQSCLAQAQLAANKFQRDQVAEEVQFEGERAAQPATALSAQNTVDALRHGWNHQAGEGGN